MISATDLGVPMKSPARPAAPPLAFHIDAHDVGYSLERAREAFGVIRDLGGNSLRTDVSWFDLQPAPDRWDGGRIEWYRDYFRAAESFELTPMAVLVGAPRWAVERFNASPQGFLDSWRRYCEIAAEAVGPHVQFVQVWNEPNSPILGLFDGRYPSLGTQGRSFFPDIFRVAALAVRQVNASVEIALNVTANLPNWEPFVTYLLHEAADAFDIIGIDVYPGTYTLSDGRDWRALTTLMRRTNDPNDAWHGKQPALLELGYSTYVPGLRSEATQANWIETALPCVRAIHDEWRERAGAGLRMISWYKLFNDRREAPLYPLSHFGILRMARPNQPVAPKAGYRALRSELLAFRETEVAHAYALADHCQS